MPLPRQTASSHDQIEGGDRSWFLWRAHQRQRPVELQELEIRVQIVVRRSRVEDEIEAPSVLLHLICIFRYDHFVRAEASSVRRLIRRRRKQNRVRAEGVSELHAHMSQAAQGHDADLLVPCLPSSGAAASTS